MAGKAGSAAMSRAGFAGWQHHHLVGQKTAILEGELYCRPHQVTLRSGLFVTVSFHRLTLAYVAKFSVMTLGLYENPYNWRWPRPQSPFSHEMCQLPYSKIPRNDLISPNKRQSAREPREERRERRAVCLNQDQTQPPHPVQQMKSNQDSDKSRIFFFNER